MPQTEAPVENSEPASSRVSVVDSSPSETESIISLSDYEFEMSVANSVASSSHSDDIILEVEAIGIEGEQFEVAPVPLSPVVDYEKWKLPIEYNLKQMLIKVTETEDLDSVTSLRLYVIARDFSLQRIPQFLPHLRELNLNGSCLMTLRDLGCGMQNLQILHVARTGLHSLDGLFGLTGLIELYAPSNKIKDLSPCSALQNAEVLDLGKNAITDIQKVCFLTLCESLKKLTLEGNPSTNIDDYRDTVKKLLPDLVYLDGQLLDPERQPLIATKTIVRPLSRRPTLEPRPSSSKDTEAPKIISRFPLIRNREILPKLTNKEPEIEKHTIIKIKKHAKRPNTSSGIPSDKDKDKDFIKLLPMRPATARRAAENDFNWLVNGLSLKLKDNRRLVNHHQLYSCRPMSGNVALTLLAKKSTEVWNDN